ncbi:MAG TPA: NAD(P)H-dependent oxidoreductase subunit E [Nitrospira sp.]|nr:NAD(P)H-dependent oxidoreductase subunit E [Nitrospira sp.]
MTTPPPNDLDELLTRLRPASGTPPNILRVLHAVQDRYGLIDPLVIPAIAYSQGVTEADVAGVLSYYPSLNTHPVGRHRIQVCMGESCLANQCDRVLREIRTRLGIEVGQTTPDGRFTLEPVSCVGNCAVSPSVRIDHELHGRVSAEDVAVLLERYQ